jgi:selenocysteine lyase/cysteine desulfurase
VAQVLKAQWPGLKVFAVEPTQSPVISGGAPSPHPIQGIGAGFIPKNLHTALLDGVIQVDAEPAREMARRSAAEEGILVGISSGATLAAIAQKARSVGALFVIDGTQSIGAWEFDVAALDPDFVICSCYKWLLGPYTLAFLYAAPRWHGMEPLELSPFNRAGVREAEGVLEPLEELIPDAARFDMGERSNFITLPMMIASLETLLEITVPTIQANSDAVNQAIMEGAARLGYQATTDRAPHLMGLRSPGGVSLAQKKILAARKVFLSVRGDAYRISPHIYNDQEDVDRLLEGLAAIKAQAA